MSIPKQFFWTLIALIASQLVGQLLPPYSMVLGTTFIVPVTALFICFFRGKKSLRFDFELKSTIVISVTVLSATLDYFYAPGTHDDIGFGWMVMFWSYGLFVLFFGLVAAKFYKDFSFSKFGFNVWTVMTIIELILFISIPLVYHRLLFTGKIIAIVGNC